MLQTECSGKNIWPQVYRCLWLCKSCYKCTLPLFNLEVIIRTYSWETCSKILMLCSHCMVKLKLLLGFWFLCFYSLYKKPLTSHTNSKHELICIGFRPSASALQWRDTQELTQYESTPLTFLLTERQFSNTWQLRGKNLTISH